MALGTDGDPVWGQAFYESIKSVGHGTTVKNHFTTYAAAKQTIFMLSEMVAARLRRYAVKAQLVHLFCQDSFMATTGRQKPLLHPSSSGAEIARTANEILYQIWNPKTQKPLRGLTVSTGKLVGFEDERQLSIFDGQIQREEKLDFTIDGVKERFGRNSINRAVLMDSVFSKDDYVDRSLEDSYLPFKR